MASQTQPPTTRPEDYQAIEDALMASARGRSFLQEHARRNRGADTREVLAAIARIETAIQQPRAGAELIRRDLVEMSEEIARTRAEIAAHWPVDSGEIDAVANASGKAAADILACAEAMQDALWRLREHAHYKAVCDALEPKVVEIITACSFQDLTARHTDKIVRVLRLLELRVNSMIRLWGLDDTEIEAVPDTDGPVESALPHAPPDDHATPPRADVASMIAAFDDIGIVDASDVALEPAGVDIEALDIPEASFETGSPPVALGGNEPAGPGRGRPPPAPARSAGGSPLPEHGMRSLGAIKREAQSG